MSPETLQRIRDVFASQQAHRQAMARTTAAQRIARLEKLRDAILARREQIHAAIAADFGKSAVEVELTELQPTLLEIKHAIGHLGSWMRPRRVGTPLMLTGTRSYVRYEPKGVVCILSPWNYPFYLLVNPLVAAVGAGNCAMMRPSEKVPHVSELLRALVEEVFPEEEAALFLGGRDVANALLDLPFDHFFFTGSPQVGRLVMAAAAKHLATVTLELGGKSPAIVDESADVQAAAERIVWGKLINAGQTCVAPDYALVHESLEAGFVEAARNAIERSYGDTEEKRAQSPDFCRMVDRASCEKLDRLVAETVAFGARLVLGGRADPERRYLPPTLLAGVRPDAPIMRAEIFGPVLPVVSFKSLDEACALARSHGKPLALYAFGRDRGHLEEILSGVPAGGSCVNQVVMHLVNANLPFGGAGESGQGNYHGEYGFRTFSHERAVLVQRGTPITRRFYPPYTEKTRRLLARVNRWFVS